MEEAPQQRRAAARYELADQQDDGSPSGEDGSACGDLPRSSCGAACASVGLRGTNRRMASAPPKAPDRPSRMSQRNPASSGEGEGSSGPRRLQSADPEDKKNPLVGCRSSLDRVSTRRGRNCAQRGQEARPGSTGLPEFAGLAVAPRASTVAVGVMGCRPRIHDVDPGCLKNHRLTEVESQLCWRSSQHLPVGWVAGREEGVGLCCRGGTGQGRPPPTSSAATSRGHHPSGGGRDTGHVAAEAIRAPGRGAGAGRGADVDRGPVRWT